jgi:hypothetical protein
MNESIRHTQKKYGSTALITAIFIGMFFILIGQKPLGKGMILGAIFSVLNFVLMGEILPLMIGKTRKKSTIFSLGSVGIRYGLLSIPLILSLKMEAFNFAAAVIGIFMVQLMILGDLAVGHLFNGGIKRI